MTAPTGPNQAQLRLADLAAYQIPELEPSDFERWSPQIARAIRRGDRAAASVAAKEYLRLRDAARVTGRFTPVLEPPAPLEQIEALLRWAAFTDGDSTTRTRVQGITQRLVLQSGRGTIARSMEADPRATGYVRVPSSTACAFCLMLATRVYGKNGQIQGVYGSREKALFASGSRRGVRAEGEKYHDFCRCSSTPIFATQTYEPPEHVRRAADIYAESTGHVSGKAKLSAFRAALK